jgi:protein ImuB
MFVCVYIPDFPVEAVVRVEPELRELAVAVVEGEPPMVNVVATNDRARSVGVESGLTQMQAEERLRVACVAKQWQIRRRSPQQEQAATAALLDSVCAFSPRVEATAPDTVIADIAGLEQLFGAPSKIARDLARRCADAGLEAHIAVAANPDAALHAARGYSGITLIAEGDEPERLGPLPLEVLVTPRYGKSTAKNEKQKRVSDLEMLDTFERWGVRTLRGLSLLPEVAVVERLGQAGLQWQRFSRGATRRELVLIEPPLQFEEAIELEYAVDLLEPLAFLLSRMLEQLCARLHSRAMATHELRLRLQLDPEVTVDREGLPIERKCFDEADDSVEQPPSVELRATNHESREFFERTIKLPVPMLDAKTFLKLLQLDLKANPPSAPVLKLWLRAEPVRPKFDQRGLFLPLTPEPQKLEITLARLSGIAGGQENVGSVEVLDTHRPDAFRMTRFAPPLPNYEQKNETKAQPRTMSALRRFRPPQPVSVMLIQDRPATIGPPRTLVHTEETTRTAYGEVTWCAGPWRTSGEWWNHEPWEREEWDVAVSTNAEGRSMTWNSSKALMHLPKAPDIFGSTLPSQQEAIAAQILYRIFRDVLSGTWFVEGEYD